MTAQEELLVLDRTFSECILLCPQPELTPQQNCAPAFHTCIPMLIFNDIASRSACYAQLTMLKDGLSCVWCVLGRSFAGVYRSQFTV